MTAIKIVFLLETHLPSRDISKIIIIRWQGHVLSAPYTTHARGVINLSPYLDPKLMTAIIAVFKALIRG